MSDHPYRLTDALITEALRARSSEPDLGLLENIVRTAGTTPQRRGWLGLEPILLPQRTLLIVATALLLATAGAIAVGAQLLLPDPVQVERMNTIDGVVEAINSADLEALRSSLTADAILEFPNVDNTAGREGIVFMSDLGWDIENFPEVWMYHLERWGLEAELGTCRSPSGSAISCAVRTRWKVLQIEIGEEWTFDFEGARVGRLVMARVDADPPNRLLPLALSDLQHWETWLRTAHPEQANRLLPTGPDLYGHFYFRFGPNASPDEIGASIREYLETRR